MGNESNKNTINKIKDKLSKTFKNINKYKKIYGAGAVLAVGSLSANAQEAETKDKVQNAAEVQIDNGREAVVMSKSVNENGETIMRTRIGKDENGVSGMVRETLSQDGNRHMEVMFTDGANQKWYCDLNSDGSMLKGDIYSSRDKESGEHMGRVSVYGDNVLVGGTYGAVFKDQLGGVLKAHESIRGQEPQTVNLVSQKDAKSLNTSAFSQGR